MNTAATQTVSRPLRSDTQRNRRQLIKAAAELFENSPTPVSLTEIARRAEVSTATAYRHFSSVEDVLHALRAQVGSELRDFSAQQTTRGMQRLEAVSRHWVSLVLEHGGAMAQMRSHRGYLERLRENTGYLTPQADALTEPLRQTTEDEAASRLVAALRGALIGRATAPDRRDDRSTGPFAGDARISTPPR
ncbi:TetR/AcrR family transcriptional regulator [Streptomyces sp. NPDC050548]|uniref:TetR/AcrR family transcriptional regulator n=1 Tax=Streptomyces sp. NPDC050548 TaxID=3365629 RepID=UPI003797A6DE